jgi:carbon storage regulator
VLVITRKPGQVIYIDGNIAIHVLGLKSGQVRIGIAAPETTNIRRGELEPRDKKEGK